MRLLAPTKSPSLRVDARALNHHEACRVAKSVLFNPQPDVIAVDLSGVDQITTSAFARLVLLRRMLLQQRRDLRLTGLRGQAARLYEIARLDGVLPRD